MDERRRRSPQAGEECPGVTATAARQKQVGSPKRWIGNGMVVGNYAARERGDTSLLAAVREIGGMTPVTVEERRSGKTDLR